MAVLTSGGTGAMLVTLLLTPIVARLYGPADFGEMAALLALCQPLVALATLQLGKAFILPQDPQAARHLAQASVGWLALFIVVLSLLLWASAPWLDPYFAVDFARWWWVVPVIVALLGLTNLANGWNTREQHFATMASAQVSRSVASGGVRVGAGWTWGSSVGGLVVGYLMGALLQLWLVLRPLPRGLLRPPSSAQAMLEPIREYRDFPLVNMPTTFLRGLAQVFPQLALAALHTSAALGLYAMAVRLIGAPGNVLAAAVRRVYGQRTATQHQAGHSLRPVLAKTTLALLAIGVAPALGLALGGERLLVWVMGEAWIGIGAYTQLLALLLLTQWVTAPAAETLVVLRRQVHTLRVQSAVLGAQVLGVLLSATQGTGPVLLVALLVAIRVLADVFIVALAWVEAGRSTASATK
ncbi:MAG: oligosaccharide flippase family protein [Pseudomonadota bacterium]